MDQYIGKLLDNRYELLERIGTGGMAVVYKGRDHRLNRLVAVKILKEELAQDAEFRRRFHDESQAVAMLTHPNIMAVYDVSHSAELDYIVMELLDGITRLTRDHSVVEDMVARGDITPEEARNHPRKNLITRALGSEEHIRADLYEKELQPGDFLLLCSDGLSNIVTDQELLYEVIHGGEPSDCCRRLVDITLSRGAPDNVTAVLLQFV